MYLKLSLVLLSIICLGQLSQTFANDAQNPAELKVFPHTFLAVLDKARNVSESILQKASHIRRKSNELKKFIPRFTSFVEDVVSLQQAEPHDLENLFLVSSIYSVNEHFFNLTGNYSESMKRNPHAFRASLALENNGFQIFRTSFETAMRDFSPLFISQKEELIAKLTPQQKRENKKFIQNFNLFKNERDVDRKFVYLKPFVTYNPQ